MEYYSAIKRNEVLMDKSQSVMVSERSQMQKTTYRMIPFIGNVLQRQICRDK